ncbi:RNA-dependent RNA polymerase 1 [Emericellopsis cladophorae]|uniref:RNA-dependent RNA polymerase n=1 Tax=Emericellopsis cladophorae TaxID=2686198 RepID=A0A9P9Y601_9HYPO|nr:RNA-dependent RNA polymerase 1 [Emericellopsis cladophorae]KAI6783970.1 RNA-dependent RNA polymerase 1 [Emericellopsis cladophorae]
MNENDAEDLRAWLHGDHHFLGRIWKAFYSSPLKTPASPSLSDKTPKDPTDNRQKKHYDYQERVYFFAVNGNHFRPPEDPACPIPPAHEALTPQCRTKLSYADFLDWAISAQSSSEQPFLKLFSRIALGLSKTDPTVILEPGQIYHKEKDLLSPTGAVMNDGIARMSRALARKVAECLNLDELPSSFQGRFGSAKGMWIVDVHDDGLDKSIWIETYPSQRKWDCDFQDPHHRTFEVRSYSKELRSANLNQQFIPILTHQAKDPTAVKNTIVECIKTGLCADLAELRDAFPDSRDLLLWLQRAGFMSTFSRQSQGQIPYLGRVPDDEGERACATLLSGFDAKCQYTSNLFWKMAERKADDLKLSMKIQIPCSAYAYMVLDFDGILAPDEIHLSFSTKFQAGDFSDTNIEGVDVLVGRSPAHFPSDIQRVRAVSKPELRRLKDVVIFPSTGDTSLADLLSGGDYDGDMAWVCWDQSIVGGFQNAEPPPKYDFVEEGYLTKNRARFSDIVRGHDGDMDKACEDFRIEGLSFAMEPSLLGKCTKYKEKLTYWTNSVDSEQAVLVSNLLGELVDQKKAGTTFTEDNWLRFRQERLQCPIKYESPEYEKERASDACREKLPKDKHVLDYIKFDVAKKVVDRALEDVHHARAAREPLAYDEHVCQVYREWDMIARDSNTRKSMMATLRADLYDLEKKWTESVNENKGFRERVTLHYERWVKIAPPVRVRGNSVVKQLKGLHDRFVPLGVAYYQTLDDDDWTAPFSHWSLLKASTTFHMFYSKRLDFAWYMAGKQILALKANVISNKPEYQRSSASTVVPYMMPLLKPDGKAIAKLAAKRKAAAAAAESDLEDKLDEAEDYWDEVGTVIDDC